VVVVGERVLVYPMTGLVYILSLGDGTVLAEVRPPFQGLKLTTERSIFFMSSAGLSEFDHRDLREVDRIDYRECVEPLYKGNRPTVAGYTLTEESVIWCASHGALMGVSRRPGPDGRRATWVHEGLGSPPIAATPLVFGDHLYWVDHSPQYPLLCFRSVGAAAE
jgi:hypothetical protein